MRSILIISANDGFLSASSSSWGVQTPGGAWGPMFLGGARFVAREARLRVFAIATVLSHGPDSEDVPRHSHGQVCVRAVWRGRGSMTPSNLTSDSRGHPVDRQESALCFNA